MLSVFVVLLKEVPSVDLLSPCTYYNLTWKDPIHHHCTLHRESPHNYSTPTSPGEVFLANTKQWGFTVCVQCSEPADCFPFSAYRIHVSQSTVDTLRSLNEGYEIVPRGKTELKVRRTGLCEMLHEGIFLLKEFLYQVLLWPSSITLPHSPS